MFIYEQLQCGVWMHLAKPLCSQHLQWKSFMVIYIYYHAVQVYFGTSCHYHWYVSTVDLAPIWRCHTLILHMCELFKFANLL